MARNEKLIDKYREIALNSGGFISFDLGAEVTENGEFLNLRFDTRKLLTNFAEESLHMDHQGSACTYAPVRG